MNKKKLDLLRKEANSVPEDYYDIPLDTVKLPSLGKVYPEDHPLCDETEVSIKSMGPMQENILASRALVKKGTVSSVLIKSCLTDQSIDVSSLVLGDKAALMLGIRLAGFGREYKATTTCPSCGEEFENVFDLGKCPIKFLDVEPVSKNTNLFEFILPKSRKTIRFSLLTDGDDHEIFLSQKARKKVIQSDIDTRPTDELLAMIKSIDGKDSRDEIAQFVMGRMHIMDSRALKSYILDISPSMELEEEVTCTHCGETDLHKVPMTTQFFWPSL